MRSCTTCWVRGSRWRQDESFHPAEDENGNALTLKKFQGHSIRDIRDLRITPIHAYNAYDISTIPSGWVIISYSLLKKHHDGLRAKEWDLIIIDEGQALKTWNSVRTMNVFGGLVEHLDDKRQSYWRFLTPNYKSSECCSNSIRRTCHQKKNGSWKKNYRDY
jgi:hypothetical protein